MSRISFLFESTSLHGFRHLVCQQKVGWKKGFARIFWTSFIAISFCLMVRILKTSIAKGQKSTSINLDTSYLDWTNAFPAVSLCMNKGQQTKPIKDIMGDKMTRPDGSIVKIGVKHLRLIQNLLFVNYQDPMEGISISTCNELNSSCGINFQDVRNRLIPRSCKAIIEKVYFLGEERDCDDIFIPFETESGTCFIANSLFSKNQNGKENLENFDDLPLRYSNTDYRERSLDFYYRDDKFLKYNLFIHTPEELPNGKFEAIGLRNMGIMTRIPVSTTEFLNQKDVKYESIEARDCRFPFERLETLSLPYSHNNCRYLKRVLDEIKACNCTFPLGLVHNDTLSLCEVSSFPCLNDLAYKTNEEMKTLNGILKHIEECLTPSCISMEINVVGEIEKNMTRNDVGHVKIEVINMPTMRYVRRVSFTKLDMIVQIGGTIGLFFGASVLSILELLYLFYQMIRYKDPKMHGK